MSRVVLNGDNDMGGSYQVLIMLNCAVRACFNLCTKKYVYERNYGTRNTSCLQVDDSYKQIAKKRVID